VVRVARWKGFGGETNFNSTCFETLTWAAGMGAVTNHASIFCTTHVPTIHPIIAAKQCTTELPRIAREDYSRQLQIWTSCRVVCLVPLPQLLIRGFDQPRCCGSGCCRLG
jgi:hypothetical protein